ncbi:MAG: UDP-N-acetylmuramoyl-L-alanyl-D-glutamate--2,6-diaminopimelate ligase [Planctomycetia bacterium]|nr:UDP-N-acetylmuramoyl-L-alanyl-D-glutamate--2,6-diaminopimelate ligase [Planctomycetia bacterium]
MSFQPGNGFPVFLSSILGKQDFVSAEDVQINSCSTNAQKVNPGTLFICLRNEAIRIIEEVEQAMKNGAQAAIIRRNTLSNPIAYAIRQQGSIFEVDEPLTVFGEVCQALAGNPSKRMKMIAITGTSGKTSLSYLIAGMLAESGRPVGLIGSLGVYDGQNLLPVQETTPTADKLADLLAKMYENGCSHAIVEVSSIGIDQYRLAGIQFDAICLTNIKRDHLDYHKTVDQYRRTKMQIFNYAKENAIAICNLDDRVTEAVLHLIQYPVMTVGMHPTESLVGGMLVEQERTQQMFYIVAGTDAVPVQSKIIGNEFVYDCLMTAALGISWGIDLNTIVRGIERVEHIPGRLERIDCDQPFGVFVDNANTPESLAASLRTIRSVTEGSIYCVLSAPNDQDRSKRPLMGRTAETLCDITVVTTNINGRRNGTESVNDILQGFESQDKKVRIIPKRSDAISWVLSNANPDDCVLIIGNDPLLDDSDKDTFSDRQFVRHWLYENQPCIESYWI